MAEEDLGRAPPRTLSGAYLQQAVALISEMGDPERLYGPTRHHPMNGYAEWHIQMEASGQRLVLGRVAVLMTALAAEAYANEYLWFFFRAQAKPESKRLDRLSFPDKYRFLPRLVTGEYLFSEEDPMLNALRELHGLRNALAHPKVRDESDQRADVSGLLPRGFDETRGDYDRFFNTSRVAYFISNTARRRPDAHSGNEGRYAP